MKNHSNSNNKRFVDIVIPSKNSGEDITKIFNSLSEQTFKNFEVIFVDSESDASQKIHKIIKEFSSNLKIKYFLEDNLLPGEARNLGVLNSSNDFIAFLDTKTIPNKEWLADAVSALEEKKVDVIFGSFKSSAETKFQKYVQYATYGYGVHRSLPGSLIRREAFKITGPFLSLRAGEDMEWINRAIHGLRHSGSVTGQLRYEGLPKSAFTLVMKWYAYSIESAKVDIVTAQKTAYFILAVTLIGYFFFTYNYFFAGSAWDQSPNFIPHINKILWGIFLAIYFVFRSIIKPVSVGVKFNQIFPFSWVWIGIVGLLIDIAKMPGRIFGFIAFVGRRLIK